MMATLTAVDYDPFGADSGVPRITVTPNRSVPAVGRALLDTIAGSESPDYNTMYGGGRFEDYTDHPRRPVPITSGPNSGKNSTAAGRYQFLARTWDEVKNETGLPDFSPESQDIGAWYLADKTYRQKTGRDLAKDLESAKGNPNAVKGIGKMLSGVWTSLPGGIEPNSMTSSFASRYEAPAGSTEVSSQSRRPKVVPVDYDPFAEAPTEDLPDTGGRFTDTAGQNFRTAREGESPAVAGAGEAAGRGFFRGVTFNFIDELNALASAGGIDPNDTDGMRVLGALVKGAYKKFGGDPEAEAAYRARLSQEREKDVRLQEQQPGASLAGEVGGGIAIPIGAAARGATMGRRALRSAAVGAGFGAATGLGEGTDVGDRATRAATGAALGGAIGGAASPVLDVAARGAGAAIREGGRYLFPSIETRAARMVDNARQSAERIDPNARTRLTQAEFAATPEATLADITGEPGRAIARWSANAAPEARETLNAMIDSRFSGQAGRIIGWLQNIFHFPNASAQREAIEQAGRSVNTPAYARAMHDGAGGVWDAELQRLAGAPAVQQAAREAIPSLSNRSITEGFRAPRQNPITVLDDGRAALTTTPNGNQIVPDLRFWDQVKKNIDAQIAKAERYGDRAKVQELTRLNQELVANLDRLVPSYQQARAGAAHFLGANSALEFGQSMVTSKVSNSEVRRSLARMTPTERQLAQDGFVSDYINMLLRVADRRDILNTINNNPAARERLHIMLGPQRANELEAMFRVEGVMNLFRNQVQGNSTTARQLVELGAVGTYGGVGAYMSDPQTMAQSVIAGAFVARGRNTDQRVARRVAEMLVSRDPQILQRGLQTVARNQNLMNSIRGLDQRIARMSAPQTTGSPALQSAGTGRAEDQ